MGEVELSLAAVRDALVREEDSIVFALIERARRPRNEPAYAPPAAAGGAGRSLAEFFVREDEVLHAKNLITSVKSDRLDTTKIQKMFHSFPKISLHLCFLPKVTQRFCTLFASSVSVNDTIWKMYFNELLPLFTVEGDDGNYAETVALDFACLKALSRRIHIGKYVAEVKFKDASQDYSPLIRAKDTNALMNLLTFKAVEEKVKKRVEKKARIFGQNVTLEDSAGKQEGNAGDSEFKVNPEVLSRLYDQWVMPLTKDVEVEYLLRRLD